MADNSLIATVLYKEIADLLHLSRKKAVANINLAMVHTYFEIGKRIVEHEQQGKTRAAYGKHTLRDLSVRLTAQFGRGFSVENLDRMRFFYKTYTVSNSSTALTNLPESSSFQLSWSHYLFLMRIDNISERQFYEIETAKNQWSLRELQRQFNSALYERLALSRDKEAVKLLSEQGQIITIPQDLVKDPYILEFLGLDDNTAYSESELETRIINQLQAFLLELGKGFAFIGRQVRFTFDDKHFRVDLVFYNRFLRCFVLLDLKIGEITHQDLGQMQMYVNYYDRFVKTEDENDTIGIILCKKKNDTLVEITLPKNNTQIFASKYQTFLPDKDALKALLEQVEE
jgi:predicted nuclease of restriction endonuclease-like (RecB) superfamily